MKEHMSYLNTLKLVCKRWVIFWIHLNWILFCIIVCYGFCVDIFRRNRLTRSRLMHAQIFVILTLFQIYIVTLNKQQRKQGEWNLVRKSCTSIDIRVCSRFYCITRSYVFFTYTLFKMPVLKKWCIGMFFGTFFFIQKKKIYLSTSLGY